MTGEAGCRSPSLVQSAANPPASTMMNTGLMDCTHDTGISQPNRFRLSRSSAYIVTTVNCCWKRDQNTALARNIGMNA